MNLIVISDKLGIHIDLLEVYEASSLKSSNTPEFSSMNCFDNSLWRTLDESALQQWLRDLWGLYINVKAKDFRFVLIVSNPKSPNSDSFIEMSWKIIQNGL